MSINRHKISTNVPLPSSSSDALGLIPHNPFTKNMAIAQIFFHNRILFMAYFLFWHFSLLNGPYIIDPANPTNNLYACVDCWDEVKKVAEETMRKPLLRDVRVTANWR